MSDVTRLRGAAAAGGDRRRQELADIELSVAGPRLEIGGRAGAA
jgi:hypothetical protein